MAEGTIDYVDRTKHLAPLDYGWSLTLMDREDAGGYPFLHMRIFWSEGENRQVIDRVNAEFFEGAEIGYEDLSVFTNNFNTPECHNAACSLTEDYHIAWWLLESGIGWVSTDEKEDAEALREEGLDLEHRGRYSPVGKLRDSPGNRGMKVEGGYFLLNRVMEAPSGEFHDWYRSQERFKILPTEPEDFYHSLEGATKTIKGYRENPEKFLRDYR